MKEEGHLGRCYLKGQAGDAANAVLTATGYNFRRILAWLRIFLRLILSRLMAMWPGVPPRASAQAIPSSRKGIELAPRPADGHRNGLNVTGRGF